MQLYCMFCGGKLLKSEEGMICVSCNTKFNGMIFESKVDGIIERSICMDCFTVIKDLPNVALSLQLNFNEGKAEIKA